MVTTQQQSWSAVLAGCLGALSAVPLEAWLLMLVLGAVHSVVAVVPAVGFWTAVLFVIGLNLLTSRVRKLFSPAK